MVNRWARDNLVRISLLKTPWLEVLSGDLSPLRDGGPRDPVTNEKEETGSSCPGIFGTPRLR